MGYIHPAVNALAPDAGPLPQLIGFVVRHVPGTDLLARDSTFRQDPLHHYLDVC